MGRRHDDSETAGSKRDGSEMVVTNCPLRCLVPPVAQVLNKGVIITHYIGTVGRLIHGKVAGSLPY